MSDALRWPARLRRKLLPTRDSPQKVEGAIPARRYDLMRRALGLERSEVPALGDRLLNAVVMVGRAGQGERTYEPGNAVHVLFELRRRLAAASPETGDRGHALMAEALGQTADDRGRARHRYVIAPWEVWAGACRWRSPPRR